MSDRAAPRARTSRGRPARSSNRISFDELERLLSDSDVPERALRRYLTGNASASAPFAPVIEPDPDFVDVRDIDKSAVESAFLMNWANGIARRRRQARFRRRRASGEALPLLVAEGDSWFQFPFLLDDVVDQFDARYHVWCVSAAGDTLMNMVNDAPEYIEAIAQHGLPRAFLFSGGGNDFVGEDQDGTSVVFRVLRDFEPARPARWYLETDAFAERLAFIERAYSTLLANVEQAFQGRVNVVLHGYDYAIPATAGDRRRPSWARVDQWLGEPLTRRGITDPDLQREIVRLMIDELNRMQIRLCGGTARNGRFKTAHHVDVRNTLRSVSDWADELHPTDNGFGKVAGRFSLVLDGLLKGEEIAMQPRRHRGSAPRDGAGRVPGLDPDALGHAISRAVSDILAEALAKGHAPQDDGGRHADGPPAPARGPIRDADALSDVDSAAGAGFDEAIPFIGDARRDAPFADVAKGTDVDDPAKMLDGFRLEQRLIPEAQVGTWNTVQSALLQALAEGRRAVARISVPRGDYTDYLGRPAAGWRGTGFLVGRNLLLTNHHVLNSVAVAAKAVIEFDYEVPKDDLREDLGSDGTSPKPSMTRFKVQPERLFVTSPVSKNGLDYTFVWIDDAASTEFGTIAMQRASFTVGKFDPVFVIHHPQGRLKEASLDDTEVLRILSTVIHYAADTDYGSSGAPVFDRKGRLIALHHARNEDGRETLQDGAVTTVLNEGVKIAAIAVDLENRVKRGGDDAGMAETVLGCMKGSDSLTGFFGTLGREARRGRSDVEAVVDAYKGTDQDIDIGFWNIEWLANRYTDETKLDGAATVIADLNLDIWGLSEVSPSAVKALVGRLKSRFGESFDYAFSEPDAPDSKQSTAVIWKTKAVKGRRVEWPEPIASWWQLDSRDDLPFESVDGRIFNRYPGLFHFEDAGPSRFDFFLVPLHLKAMAEGSKRRRLASLLLSRAIERMIEDGEDADWVVGGDVNDDLASGDFDDLTGRGFRAMSAADEKAGAFTYLKSPKSLIDNIFLSPTVSSTVGGADYFIVAKERSLDHYVRRVSDHRPVVLRISLAPSRGAGRATEFDLDELVDKITGRRRAAHR